MNPGAYAEIRDSGVPWIGALPSHWGVHRLKWTVTGCTNGVWGDEPDGENDVVCVRVADFDRDALRVSLEAPTLRAVEPSQFATRKLHRGDLLIEKSGGGDKQLVGCVVSFDHDADAVCSNFVARMPVELGHCARYWCYAHAGLYAGRMNYPAIKQTTGIQNLDASAYLDTLVAYPPLDEQRQIAAYLDWKTGQIDALIAKKRELIEKLKEQRIAIIARAVAKGLHAHVEFRDCGVPWLGTIPKHWRVARLKFQSELKSGHTPSRSVGAYWVDCTIPWISLNDSEFLREHDSIAETAHRISELGLANSSAVILPAGVVVLSRDATVGLSAITEVPMAVSQHFIAYLCGEELVPKYLLFAFKAMAQHLQSLQTGTTIATIGMPEIRGLVCSLPPVDEQLEIVEHLELETVRLDRMASKVEMAIERLTEYRSAVITAATTGQLDVRGIVIPPPA